MKTTPTRFLILGLALLAVAAALPAAAQDAAGNAGADQAAQPATAPADSQAAAAAEHPAPAAAPADESAPAPRVTMGFGTGIDRATRQLVGEGTSFAAGDTVWCRTVLEDLPYPTTVTHAWYYDGRTMARVELNVGSAHWRTWSSKIILPDQTGSWEVKVLNADGTVLDSGTFEVQ